MPLTRIEKAVTLGITPRPPAYFQHSITPGRPTEPSPTLGPEDTDRYAIWKALAENGAAFGYEGANASPALKTAMQAFLDYMNTAGYKSWAVVDLVSRNLQWRLSLIDINDAVNAKLTNPPSFSTGGGSTAPGVDEIVPVQSSLVTTMSRADKAMALAMNPAPTYFEHSVTPGKPTAPTVSLSPEDTDRYTLWSQRYESGQAFGFDESNVSPSLKAAMDAFKAYLNTAAYRAWAMVDIQSRDAQWRYKNVDTAEAVNAALTKPPSLDSTGAGTAAPAVADVAPVVGVNTYEQYRGDIVSISGTRPSLAQDVVTVGRPLKSVITISILVSGSWQAQRHMLDSGAASGTDTGHTAPFDYNATTNNVHWVRAG